VSAEFEGFRASLFPFGIPDYPKKMNSKQYEADTVIELGSIRDRERGCRRSHEGVTIRTPNQTDPQSQVCFFMIR
jgi:hypothetical protein